MKKIFTLICAFVGMTSAVNAETIDDVAVCKHSYVLVMDQVTGTVKGVNKGAKPGKGQLFGDGFFLDVTGGSVADNKGSWDLSSEETIAILGTDAYAEYGDHLNSFRLKNGQDVIAMKVTAGSKVIILGQKHTRYPMITDTAPSDKNMQGKDLGSEVNTVETNGYFSWVAPDDMTIYIGSKGGDYYISYIIVEANEAPGTPSVKVGPQTFADGLWYREVVCKPNTYEEMGTVLPTVVTYTTDGTAPTAESKKYTEPIKCYKDQTVKFQAFVDSGDGNPADICPGADNDGIVSFSFKAPTITAEGGNVTITSEYEGAKNFYKYGADTIYTEGSSVTLTESATVTAMSKIVNGSYATFESAFTSKDVYVLNPIKEEKVIAVTAGTAVVDSVATATSTTGTVYMIEGGEISADKMDFFVKNLEFGAIANVSAAAKYQVPTGQEAYIKMNNTNISFNVAEGDSVNVHVICSKNACKNIDDEDAKNRQCKVNVDGVNYGSDDILVDTNITDADGNVIETLPGNEIKFGLGSGIHTFKKFSGTGNILISSITITPVTSVGINNVKRENTVVKTAKMIKNNRIVIVKNGVNYSVTGAQLK